MTHPDLRFDPGDSAIGTLGHAADPAADGVLQSRRTELRQKGWPFDLPLWSVRLRADPRVTEQRLRGRYGETRPKALQWHLDRYRAEARELEVMDLDDLVIDTDRLHPRQIAQSIAQRAAILP